MAQNRVDATLAQADVDAVMAALVTIRQKLPFLVNLSAEDRRALPKMGDKSQGFVRAAQQVAALHPEILPGTFNGADLQKDVVLFDALKPISIELALIGGLIDDTLLEVGSEAYAAALVFYQHAKGTAFGDALDEAADSMSRRFARKSPAKVTPQ
jgi:hypothetical protein